MIGFLMRNIIRIVPYVCLRLPTGGGKTLLASCTIPLVCRGFLGRDFVMAIWLVPTTAILEQTYNCLNDRRHPYRMVLDDAFDGNVNILRIEDAQGVSKADLAANVNVIVSTYASYRVDRVEGRKVYRENGALAVNFTDENIKRGHNLECYEGTAKPIPSLANLINMNQPLIIVDEAHNARTDLTFETLERLNPSCIIEYTATPKTQGMDRSNVLYRVSAATLKAEKMIKMPVELLTNEDWQVTINNAVTKQRELEELALLEEGRTGEYIRPIVLLQAEHDSEIEATINVKEVRNFLTGSCGIPTNQVAVATGEERGIEGKNLNEKSEPIRFIITKQALKEGWDCPFAYVFCSVANVGSSKDVEQLLGRILRMPDVKEKTQGELNRSYAYVASDNFYQTAMNLQDSLTQGGFDAKEASQLIEVSPSQPSLGDFFGNPVRTFVEIPEVRTIPREIREKIEINRANSTITFNQPISKTECEEFKKVLTNENDKEIVEQVYRYTNRIRPEYVCPQRQGIEFRVQQLVIDFDGEERIFDEECLILPDWNLAKCAAELNEKDFPVKVDAGEAGLLDLDSRGNVIVKHSDKSIQLELSSLILSSGMDRNGLLRWLVKECRNGIVPHAQAVVYINNVVDGLIQGRGLNINQLVFKRMQLREALTEKIKLLIAEAKRKGFQSYFEFSDRVSDLPRRLRLGSDFIFPADYPVDDVYTGSYNYTKHYYDQIGSMNGEEAECAFLIDTNSNVEFWVRNLQGKEDFAFWIQTSSDKFYPDFVIMLKSGVIAFIEYKGEDRYSNDDSKEKRKVGEYYADISKGKCKFFMLNGTDWDKLREVLK
jgi:type III restriction enzyme